MCVKERIWLMHVVVRSLRLEKSKASTTLWTSSTSLAFLMQWFKEEDLSQHVNTYVKHFLNKRRISRSHLWAKQSQGHPNTCINEVHQANEHTKCYAKGPVPRLHRRTAFDKSVAWSSCARKLMFHGTCNDQSRLMYAGSWCVKVWPPRPLHEQWSLGRI